MRRLQSFGEVKNVCGVPYLLELRARVSSFVIRPAYCLFVFQSRYCILISITVCMLTLFVVQKRKKQIIIERL